MWGKLIIFFLLPLLPASSFGTSVTYLHPDEPHVQDVQILQALYPYNSIHVFCKEATPLSLWNVFQSNRLHLQIADGEDYKQYKAYSIKEVYQAHDQVTEDFEGKPLGLWTTTTKERTISLSVHHESYYAISTNSKFVLTLEEISCDMERVAQFIFGFALWASCPLLADSRLMVYCTAAALGAHLAAVFAIFLAVLSSGEEPSIARIFPLKANFKQVYEERPTSVILILLIGAWAFQAGAEKVRFLWRYRIIRKLHCRFLRSVAYLLIFTSTDHYGVGWVCVLLLLPWPECLKFYHSLKSRYNQRSKQRSPCGRRSRRMDTYRYCAGNPNEINLRRGTNDPDGACESRSCNNRRNRKHHSRLHRQGCEDQDHPSTFNPERIFHPSRRSTPK